MKKVKSLLSKHFHPAHNTAHLVYFAAVALEGHGFYAMAAGGLFVITVIGLAVGEEA